ncbi:IS4 family transposase [Enterococcus mundtii]|uniref:IS4 family transposase n=1 Tax=Enterococcus mundtii TaxID=53346 RepID=A0A2C9XR25_ENTMU|nr:IS4 family transposase [Enterococcus mundtii]
MMRKQSIEVRNQFVMLTIDDFVSKDHLVRKIDAAIQFDFIYPIVESTYSTYDFPSIDPVVLIKLVFIQYLFGILSIRQTSKDVETNVAYRWFLCYSFEDSVIHSCIFGKNYVRKLKETTLFENIFSPILEQAVKAGFITEENLYIDSTHIKANANKHKFTKKWTYAQAKTCPDELEDEISKERIATRKRPFTWDMESDLSLKK